MAVTTDEKPNAKIEKNLERLHGTAISQQQPLAFFKALEAYIRYALETPVLKAIFDNQINERNARYEKIEEIEVEAEAEMRIAKEKLFDIIKSNSTDSNLFDRHSTFPKPPFNDLVKELEAYENKEMSRSGFYSNTMQGYLFDIATNLFKAGYVDELKDFHVPQEKYGEYYQRINGTSGYWFAGDESGSFIFSHKWPERFEQENILERERVLKPWGSFEALFQFKRAYDAVLENMSFWQISSGESAFGHMFRAQDVADIAFMAEDLQHLMGQTRSDSPRKYKSDLSPELDMLNIVPFKNAFEAVHDTFLQHLESAAVEETAKPEKNKERKDIVVEQENLCFGTIKIPVKRGQKAMVELFLKNAKIYRNDRVGQKGTEIELTQFQKVGGYQNEEAVRNALNKLRTKLKSKSFPATIENPQTGKYQLVIKYQ